MDYTLEDLRGKYVRVGTPEAEVFLSACVLLGVNWCDGTLPHDYTPESETIAIANKFSDDSKLELAHADIYWWINRGFLPFTPKPQWSIYTNDKPLCKLSDEQAAALFNAWRGGEKIESSVQCDVWLNCMFPEWKPLMVYRIKQKSECELFVEKCVGSINSHNSDDPVYYEEWFEQLFDAGCRFTKDN